MNFKLRKPPIKPDRLIKNQSVVLMSAGETISWPELNNKISFPFYAMNPEIKLISQECDVVKERGYYESYSTHEITQYSQLVLSWQEQEDLNQFNERLTKWREEMDEFELWQEENKDEIKQAVQEKKAQKIALKDKMSAVIRIEKQIKELTKELKSLDSKS